MAAVAFAGPYVVTTVTFTIGTTEYSCSVNTAEWTTAPNILEYDTYCGAKSAVGYSRYSLHVVGAQDWFDNNSLCRYLKRNEGISATVVVEWTSAVDPGDRTSTQGTVILVAPPWGGQANTIGVFDITMPVNGTFTEFLEASL